MAKMISAVFGLKDKFSKPLAKIKGKSSEEIKAMKRDFKKFRNSVKHTFKSIGKYAAVGLTAASVAVGKYLKESLVANSIQEKATVTLTNSLKKQKGMTDELLKSTLNYAGVIQNVGVIGDEVLQVGMNELALGGLRADQIKKLTGGMADMLVKEKGLNATQMDSLNVGKALSKAVNGKVKALQTYGIYLSDNENKMFKMMSAEERVNFLTKKIEDGVGGVNKAMLNTPLGMLQSLKNNFGDIQEEVGAKLQPIITILMEKILRNMPKIKDRLMIIIDKLEFIAPIIADSISKAVDIAIIAFDKLLSVITFVSENWTWIKPVVAGIASVVGVMKIYNTVLAIHNAILLANPVMLVIAGVGTLIGVLVVAYENFESVIYVVGALINAVKSMWGAFKTTKAFDLMMKSFEMFKNLLVGIFDIVGKVTKGVGTLLSKGVSKVANFFGGGDDKKESTNKENSIPHYAMGTKYTRGGNALINERGGEIQQLPNGTQIIPHDLSKQMITNNSKSSITVNVVVQGNLIGNKEYANYISNEIVKELKLAGGNI